MEESTSFNNRRFLGFCSLHTEVTNIIITVFDIPHSNTSISIFHTKINISSISNRSTSHNFKLLYTLDNNIPSKEESRYHYVDTNSPHSATYRQLTHLHYLYLDQTADQPQSPQIKVLIDSSLNINHHPHYHYQQSMIIQESHDTTALNPSDWHL